MHTAIKVSHLTSFRQMEIKHHPFLPLAFDGSEGQCHILTMEKESLVPIVWVQEPF